MSERTISIYRTEKKGFEEFTVPVHERTTVVDVLEYVRLNLDPDLMFRQSCHHGACGTCGMAVNGEFVLGCIKRIGEIAEEAAVRIEPLPTMHQIGDLAFDPAEFFNEFPDEITYKRDSEVNPDAATPEGIERYERFENCIECGLCVSSCPVDQSWMGPAALASVYREIQKHPERIDEYLDLAEGERGAAACTMNFSCVRVCPTNVKPGKQITLINRKIKNRAAGKKYT